MTNPISPLTVLAAEWRGQADSEPPAVAAALLACADQLDAETAISPGRAGGIEHILAAVDGEVFRSAKGETVIFLTGDPYVISVDEDGDTVSAHLVTVPPAEIAEAMDADEAEIGGWSTGWEC